MLRTSSRRSLPESALPHPQGALGRGLVAAGKVQGAPAHSLPLFVSRHHCCRANSIRSLKSPFGKWQPWPGDPHPCGPGLGPVLPSIPVMPASVLAPFSLSPGLESATSSPRKGTSKLERERDSSANPGKGRGVLVPQAETLRSKATNSVPVEPVTKLQILE